MKKSDVGKPIVVDSVVCRAGESLLAFFASDVSDIVKLPSATLLPCTPSYVEGMVNIEGRIATQIDMAHLLLCVEHGSDQPNDTFGMDNDRLLLVHAADALFAIKVNEVCSKAALAYTPSDDVEQALRSAMTTWEGREVQWIDVAALGQYMHCLPAPDGRKGFAGKLSRRMMIRDEGVPTLVFVAGNTRYGIPMHQIMEIMQCDAVTVLPNVPDYISGLMLIRDELVLTLSLSSLLGQHSDAIDDSWALLVQQDGETLALRVSKVEGVTHYVASTVQLLDASDSAVAGVLLDQEFGTVMLLDPARVLSSQVLEHVSPHIPHAHTHSNDVQDNAITRMLEVSIGQRACLIPLANVNRVMQGRSIEKIMDPAGVVAGAIEVDGHIVPVLDARLILPFEVAHLQVNEFVIISNRTQTLALGVTHINQILDVPTNALTYWPNADALLVIGMAHFQDAMYMLLGLDRLQAVNEGNHMILPVVDSVNSTGVMA